MKLACAKCEVSNVLHILLCIDIDVGVVCTCEDGWC